MSVVALHCDPARSRGSWQCGLTEVGGGDRGLAMAVTCSYRVTVWR